METQSVQNDSSEMLSDLNSLSERQLQLVKEAYLDGWKEGLTYALTLLDTRIDKHYGDGEDYFWPEYLKQVKNGKEN